MSFMSRAFRLAKYRDHENPIYEAKRLDMLPAKTEQDHGSWFTLKELREKVLRKILASEVEDCQRDHDVIFLLAATGMRNGEMGRLRPMDIEWNGSMGGGGVLLKNNPKGRKAEAVHGKSKGMTRHFFGPELGPVLARLVVGVPKGGVILSGDDVTKLCTRWQKALGIKKLTAKNLRNTFAQAAVAIDKDASWRQMGHADSRMIERSYTTADEHRAREASSHLLQKLAGG